MEITQKQVSYINAIQKVMGIKFTGSSREEASAYISKYANQYQIRKSIIADSKPTADQLRVISNIEYFLDGISFTGRTREEASRFISENMKDYRKAVAMYDAYAEATNPNE